MTTLLIAASVGDQITQAINDVAKALRYPVLIAALIALVAVAWEIGRLAVEAWKRSQRPKTPFDQVAAHAAGQKAAGDAAGSQATLKGYSYGERLQVAAVNTLFATDPVNAQRAVVDYDLYVSKRLDRVRLLVRAGPALGLMGTLIPLAPALAALGKGQPSVLADELQTAFAVTVVGVLVGLVAFSVALLRERFYTRDLADLEYLRELRGDAVEAPQPATAAQPAAAAPDHRTATDQPQVPTPPAPGRAAAPAVPARQAGAVPAAAPGSTPAVTPPPAAGAPGTPPPAFPPVPAAAPKKKKFGLKKKAKTPPAAPAFPPPPAAPGTPPPPAPGSGTATSEKDDKGAPGKDDKAK